MRLITRWAGWRMAGVVISRIGKVEVEGNSGAFLLFAVFAGLSLAKLVIWQAGLCATLVLLSLLTHELAHLAMARALGVPVRAIGVCFRGAYLRRVESANPKCELLIASAGPAASLLLYFSLRQGGTLTHWVGILNLVLAISNLLPLRGTDGRRILSACNVIVLGSQHPACEP